MLQVPDLEREAFYLLNHKITSSFLDATLPFITTHVPWFFVFFVVIYFVFDRNPKRLIHIFGLMLLALVIGDALANFLKHLIQRPRPPLVLPNVRLLVGIGRSFAMPSGHALNTASVTMAIWLYLSRNSPIKKELSGALKGYLIGLVAAVGISRVYVGAHWPGDVLAGVVLGAITGWAVYNFLQAQLNSIVQGRTLRTLGLFLLGLTLFRYYYIFTGPLRLSPDEAQYWDWSRYLQLSYYSKPPLVAYMIRLGTEVFGHTEMGVRFFAPLFNALSSLLVYLFTRKTALWAGLNTKDASLAGLLAGLVFQFIPLFSAFGVIFTIDSPLLLFWSLALWLFVVALERGRTYWLALGVVVGLGMLTKFTMVLFPLCAFLYLLSEPQHRRVLMGTGPWAGLLVALVFYIPVLYWNSQHQWVYFKHLAGHGGVDKGITIDPKALGEFVGSQFGVITPVLLGLMLWAVVWLYKKEKGTRVFFWFSMPVMVLFTFKSLLGKVQANWPMPGYIAMLAGLGLWTVLRWNRLSTTGRTFIAAGTVLAVLISAVSYYPSVLHLPPRVDPTIRLKGWRSLATRVDTLRNSLKNQHFVFSDRYQITAEMAFYLKDHPRTYCVNLGRRMNQYDLWEGFYNLVGYDGVFVQKGQRPLPQKIVKSFEQCQSEVFTVRHKGRPIRTFTIGLCRGFRGMQKVLPHRY